MKRPWYILIAIVISAAVLMAVTVHVRRDLGWVDSVSGSHKSQTVWRFGGPSTLVVSDTPLAERYRKLGLRWEADWRNVQGTSVSLFGRVLGRGHGPAPEIYRFKDPNLQRWYLAAASDDDVRALFRVMSGGTEAEQKAAVDAACERAFNAVEAGLRGR